MTALPTPTQAQACTAIAHHGRECEAALRCAATAESHESLGAGMADSFRKVAALHSDDAFKWARHLRPTGCAQ